MTRALKALRKLYTLTGSLTPEDMRDTKAGPLLSELRLHADERVAAAANGVRKAWKSAVAGGEPPAATGSAPAKARADAKPEPAPAKKKPRLHEAYPKPARPPKPEPAPRTEPAKPAPAKPEPAKPAPAKVVASAPASTPASRACTRRARAAAAHGLPPPRPAAIDPFAAAYVSGGGAARARARAAASAAARADYLVRMKEREQKRLRCAASASRHDYCARTG